jgi:peptidase E
MRAAVLGPQRLKPTLIDAIRKLGIDGQIATVTAGWQEREPDDAELHQHLEERSYNLRLYERAEAVYREDRELSHALHQRQETLRQVQELYRIRLNHAKAACRAFDQRRETSSLVEEQRNDAIEALRRLDQEHLDRCQRIQTAFEERWQPQGRDAVRRQRDQIRAVIAASSALAVAGGHVAVLLNRLRLFGLIELCHALPVIAWSAGAMALSERVVLFHDHPPQGAGNAEIFDRGCGVLPGIVPLPHAHRRLRLNDIKRVSLMARRFEPARCVALDDGAQIYLHDGAWHAAVGVQQLGAQGQLIAGTAA